MTIIEELKEYLKEKKYPLSKVAKDVEYFAKKEGLSAHANSIAVRFED